MSRIILLLVSLAVFQFLLIHLDGLPTKRSSLHLTRRAKLHKRRPMFDNDPNPVETTRKYAQPNPLASVAPSPAPSNDVVPNNDFQSRRVKVGATGPDQKVVPVNSVGVVDDGLSKQELSDYATDVIPVSQPHTFNKRT